MVRRAVLGHDPEAARKRAAEAERDAEVQAWTEASGNAALAGRELPEADVITADRRLTALARWLSGTQVHNPTITERYRLYPGVMRVRACCWCHGPRRAFTICADGRRGEP